MRLKILLSCLFILLMTAACGREIPPTPAVAMDTVGIPTRPSDEGNGPVVTIMPTEVPPVGSGGGEPAVESTPVIIPTPSPVPCETNTDWLTYTVQGGDTLGEIAAAVGSTVTELMEVNCLIDPNILAVGQSLSVPQLPPTPEPEPTDSIIVWNDYRDTRFEVRLAYPEQWVMHTEETGTRIEGEEGFIWITVATGGSLDALAQNEVDRYQYPYGSAPTIESIMLSDGRPGRLILPAADQVDAFNNMAAIIAPYAQPVMLNGYPYTHLMIQANEPNIRLVLESLSLPSAAADVNIRSFTAEIIAELSNGGRTVRFTWDGDGATYGRLTSGTTEQFIAQWDLEPSGTRTIDLNSTIFPDPVMTLQLVNEITGEEETAQVQLEWPCQNSYFFSPASDYCPAGAAATVNGIYQPFENGFMIWRPFNAVSHIHVFYADGSTAVFTDDWTASEPVSDPSLIPPSGLDQPMRGLGKVWRENSEVRDQLGWATSAESAYVMSYQGEWRELPPGVVYMTRPDGSLLKILDGRWEIKDE